VCRAPPSRWGCPQIPVIARLPAAPRPRSKGAWEDALRVAKVCGGLPAVKAVAYGWAVAVGADGAGGLLQRLGLGEAAVDAAVEAGDFEYAFQLAQVGGCFCLETCRLPCRALEGDALRAPSVRPTPPSAPRHPHPQAAAPQRVPDVHLKHAMFLEDNGRFAEAEGEFISAGKPREAVDMFTHAQDWDAAMRVAEAHAPDALGDVLAAQAEALAASGQLSAAEGVFLRARRPDAALTMYRGTGQWQAALRVAEAYLPARVAEVHLEMAAAMSQGQGAARGRCQECAGVAFAGEAAGQRLDHGRAWITCRLAAQSHAGHEGAGAAAAATARAQAYERGNDYARAVEAYLSPSGEGAAGADLDALQRCWEAGLALATRHQVRVAGQRLPHGMLVLQLILRHYWILSPT
jgi:intraflagellar transport protein 172